MKRLVFPFTMILLLSLAPPTFAPVSRPAITGLCFARIKVTSLGSADKFYGEYLGLPRFNQCWGMSTGACYFITPYQDLEIVKEDTPQTGQLLESIGIWTEHADALRSYFLARGLKPGELSSTQDGEKQFEISDPEGHHLVFLSSVRGRGSLDSRMQASHHMIHAGFVVHDRAIEDGFYKGVLGFRLYWHGGMQDSKDDWVAMQVPDGGDWLEYMLNIAPNADHHTLGVMNHIALGVLDIKAAKAQLIKNGWKPGEEPKLGRDGKWQLNLYDPDDTRSEFMEFEPAEKPCCSEFMAKHPRP
jgi:catechol 2,3-dioxygenase-like lactoylglutathione lyase family enzyme